MSTMTVQVWTIECDAAPNDDCLVSSAVAWTRQEAEELAVEAGWSILSTRSARCPNCPRGGRA